MPLLLAACFRLPFPSSSYRDRTNGVKRIYCRSGKGNGIKLFLFRDTKRSSRTGIPDKTTFPIGSSQSTPENNFPRKIKPGKTDIISNAVCDQANSEVYIREFHSKAVFITFSALSEILFRFHE